MTRKDLQDFRKLIIERASLQNQIKELDTQIQHITPSYGAQPRGGKSADNADKILKLVELKKEYERRNDNIADKQIKIETVLNHLDDPVERAVLRSRYIDNMRWEEIQTAINYERAQTFRVHIHAIKNFEKIKDDTK